MARQDQIEVIFHTVERLGGERHVAKAPRTTHSCLYRLYCPPVLPHMYRGIRTPRYSHDYGSVHFTYISTEHDISPGSVQYRWLQRDLAAVDRCATPWVVLALHRPLYVVFPVGLPD